MRPFEPDDEPIDLLVDLTERRARRSLRDAVLLAVGASGYVVDWQIEGGGSAVPGMADATDAPADLADLVG